MLSKRRGFYRDGKEIIRTPILLPSFSSKGFPNIQEIFELTQEVITGEILVSAYDLYHKKLDVNVDFAEAVFLDSGGYEASKDFELSDINVADHKPLEWSADFHRNVLEDFSTSRPLVVISYDHPKERIPYEEQIKRALSFEKKENVFIELLFKPHNEEEYLLDIHSIVKRIPLLEGVDAIGVTEKELGRSLKDRMVNIATLRRALDANRLQNMPIHIFGSLDTISTPLYFLAGADIFDGLTWLRYAYFEGLTVYRENFAALSFGIDTVSDKVYGRTWYHNYQYMQKLQNQMKNFLLTSSFKSFEHHSDLLESAFQTAFEQTEVSNGR